MRDKSDGEKVAVSPCVQFGSAEQGERADREAEPSERAEERAEHGEGVTRLLSVPERIDWARWSVENINAVLRTYWFHVELGDDLRPVRAERRIPDEYWTPDMQGVDD